MASAPAFSMNHPMVRFSALSSAVGRSSLLEAAHRQTEASIEALEATISGDLADGAQLKAQRKQIRQSNRARGQIASQVCRHLICAAGPPFADWIKELQRQESELFQAVWQHMRQWPHETAFRDWPGYTEAAKLLCRAIREIIHAEKEVLYPLLKRDSEDAFSPKPALNQLQ
jgi:hypothetical protein